MRLVQHHEGIAAHQARRIGSHPPGNAIPLEQQARADHVHRADDDCRGSRIVQPFAIIDVLAAQGGDRQWPVSECQPLPHLLDSRASRAMQGRADVCGKGGGLIDHGAAVDDVDQATGQACSCCPSQQPERHDRGFAEAGRDVHGWRELTGGQPFEQTSLPRKGLVSGERPEGFGEVERSRHDSASLLVTLPGPGMCGGATRVVVAPAVFRGGSRVAPKNTPHSASMTNKAAAISPERPSLRMREPGKQLRLMQIVAGTTFDGSTPLSGQDPPQHHRRPPEAPKAAPPSRGRAPRATPSPPPHA